MTIGYFVVKRDGYGIIRREKFEFTDTNMNNNKIAICAEIGGG